MATNWGIVTNSKASTTDDFTLERTTRISITRDDAWVTWGSGSRTNPRWEVWNQNTWESITNIWSLIGEDTTWTIDGGAVTKDSD